MTTPQWIAFAVLFIPSMVALGWIFFRTWDSFFDALLYVLTPDIISLFRGRLSKDWWGEFKFGYYIFACFIVAAGELSFIEKISSML